MMIMITMILILKDVLCNISEEIAQAVSTFSLVDTSFQEIIKKNRKRNFAVLKATFNFLSMQLVCKEICLECQ